MNPYFNFDIVSYNMDPQITAIVLIGVTIIISLSVILSKQWKTSEPLEDLIFDEQFSAWLQIKSLMGEIKKAIKAQGQGVDRNRVKFYLQVLHRYTFHKELFDRCVKTTNSRDRNSIKKEVTSYSHTVTEEQITDTIQIEQLKQLGARIKSLPKPTRQ